MPYLPWFQVGADPAVCIADLSGWVGALERYMNSPFGTDLLPSLLYLTALYCAKLVPSSDFLFRSHFCALPV
jgi:hypothetical protein